MTHMQYVYSCRAPDGRTVEVRIDTDEADAVYLAAHVAAGRFRIPWRDVIVRYVSTRSRGFSQPIFGRVIERNKRRTLEAA